MRFTLIFLLLCVSQAAKYKLQRYPQEADRYLMQKNIKEFCTPGNDLLGLSGVANLLCHYLPLHLPYNYTHYATFDQDNTTYFENQPFKVFTHKKKAYLLHHDEDVVKTEAFVKDLYEKRENIVDV